MKQFSLTTKYQIPGQLTWVTQLLAFRCKWKVEIMAYMSESQLHPGISSEGSQGLFTFCLETISRAGSTNQREGPDLYSRESINAWKALEQIHLVL